jgi:serine/threonine-protein kinase
LARPDSAWYRARKFVGRNKVAVGAAAAVFVAVVSGASVSLWQAREARQQAEKSELVTRFVLNLVRDTDPDQGSKRGTTTVEMLIRAPETIQKEFGQNPEVEVRLLSAVGYSLLGLGEINASIPVFQSAIGTAERRLPAHHREALLVRIRLGEALLTASRVDEAEVPLMQGLAGMRAIDDVSGTVTALRWISRLHSRRRDNAAAIAAAEEAVQLARTRLSPDEIQQALPAELDLLSALQVARRRGQLEPAKRAYELAEALYPDRIVRTRLTAREAYGTALVAEGDAVEGVKLLASALEDAKALFGPKDRMLGYFAGRLAGGQSRIGDAHGALASARLARRTWDVVHGDKLHSDLGFGLMYEGTALTALQRFDEAARLLGESADLLARTQGQGSRVALVARAGQAVALARNGDLAAAERILGAAPEKLDTVEEVGVAGRFGLLRLLQGRPGEAAHVLRTSLDRLQALGADRFEAASQQVWLASALADLGRAEEARALVETALKTYVATQPSSSPAQAEAWEVLARVEMAAGDPGRAAEASATSVAFWHGFAPTSAAAVRALLIQARAQQQAGDKEAAVASVRRARSGAAALTLDADRALLASSLELLQ